MALASNRRRRNPVPARLLDRHLHGPLRHRKAEAPMTVDDGRRLALFDDLELCARHDVPLFHLSDVVGNVDDAVGVVARQVGADAVPCNHLGLAFQRTCRAQQLPGKRFQYRRGYSWHCEILWAIERLGSFRPRPESRRRFRKDVKADGKGRAPPAPPRHAPEAVGPFGSGDA